MEKQFTSQESLPRYCKNCGWEYHQGPLWKEMTDGDGKVISVKICEQGRK